MSTARRQPASKASKSRAASKPDQRAPERQRAKTPAKAGKPAINSALNTAGMWQLNALMFVVLMIVTLVLYAGDLRLGFFKIDDQQYVVNDPWVHGVTMVNLRHILTTPYFVNYSPLHL